MTKSKWLTESLCRTTACGGCVFGRVSVDGLRFVRSAGGWGGASACCSDVEAMRQSSACRPSSHRRAMLPEPLTRCETLGLPA
jgi:hypothetical protein